ncbi:MAG: hypothetical protein ABH879_07705 [archaeon]
MEAKEPTEVTTGNHEIYMDLIGLLESEIRGSKDPVRKEKLVGDYVSALTEAMNNIADADTKIKIIRLNKKNIKDALNTTKNESIRVRLVDLMAIFLREEINYNNR